MTAGSERAKASAPNPARDEERPEDERYAGGASATVARLSGTSRNTMRSVFTVWRSPKIETAMPRSRTRKSAIDDSCWKNTMPTGTMAARNRDERAGRRMPARRGSADVSGAEAVGVPASRRKQREKDDGGREGRHAVDEKERRPRDLREEAAHRGADAHAEVDREALERERGLAAVRRRRACAMTLRLAGRNASETKARRIVSAGDRERAARERKEEEERARTRERDPA